MPSYEPSSLLHSLTAADDSSDRWLWGAAGSANLAKLCTGSSIGDRIDHLRERSVLVATDDQLTAALAMIELDGIVRRMVLCPPDLRADDIPYLLATASADAIVVGGSAAQPSYNTRHVHVVTCHPGCTLPAPERRPREATEWVLLTSGTTGLPKLVVHTLSSLTGAISDRRAIKPGPVWSTFYDIRRYGGLQIFLRAIIGGGSIVFSSARESTTDFLARAGAHGVTRISGTPSHWRGALMSGTAQKISPRYVRLSGEIADQAILDRLRAAYPDAEIAHAFASTEAGVAFDVGDGLAGFPATLLENGRPDIRMQVTDGSLRIKSTRNAFRYLGETAESLADPDGFVDTGDMVELRDRRYHFVGRRSGVIIVGGFKVHPEEIEAIINRHPCVRMSLVKARRSSIMGEIVVADVMKSDAGLGSSQAENEVLKREILDACRSMLPRHKVPVEIRFVASLGLSPAGKLARPHA
jgi:acyl-CoA synthetase (AMP-forming)/AMP-acid ligase II